MKVIGEAVQNETNVHAMGARLHALLIWGAYFALVSMIAFHDGRNTTLSPMGENLSIFATNAEMIRTLGGADSGSYASGARDVFENGWFTEKNKWLIALWPPGYFLLQAGIMFVAGESAPVPAILLLFNVVLWSFVLYSSYLLFRRYLPAWLAFVLPMVLVLSAFARSWFFRHGIIFTEGVSTGFWLLGISWVGLSIVNRKIWLAAAGGAALALAAYFRHQAEMSGNLVCGAALAAFALVWFIATRRVPAEQPRRRIVALARETPWKFIFAACAAFLVCTLPWRAHNYVVFGHFSWPRVDYYWKYLWMQDEEFAPGAHAAGAAFLMPGRVNVACHIFPKECARMRQMRIEKGEDAYPYSHYKKRAIKGFAERPLPWISYKLEKLPAYWFSEPTVVHPVGWQWVEGSLTGLAALVGVLGIVLTWGSVLWPLIFSSALAVYFTTFGTMMFLHLDVRYLYFSREFSVYLALLVIAVLIGRKPINPPATFKANAP